MKRTLISLCLFSSLISHINAQTSFVFGVKPGLVMNSAYIGIQQGNFMPYLGTDLLWISADGDYEKLHENYPTSEIFVKELTTVDFSGKAFLVIPHIGGKYFFNMKPAKPYVFTGLFFGLPIVDLNAEGSKETWKYENNQLIEHNEEDIIENFNAIEQTVKDALGFWGFMVGAGAEYFFNPAFSIGGEYGLRIIFDSAKYEDTRGDLDPATLTGYRNTWKSEVSASLKISYAVVSVNFYF